MIAKVRTESEKLIILRSLNTRMELADKDTKHYLNLEKGYEGEVKFDSLTETIQGERLIINDLCLEFNHTEFQIDTLMISQNTIHPFEVKNYEGDYKYESGNFRILSGTEILNPLSQLKRSETLLRQLLPKLGFQSPVKGNLIFINPNFTLYQAPLDEPITYPTQLNRFLHNINHTPSKLQARHKKLAEQLISMHKTDSSYTKLPSYRYEHLRKGITCSICRSFFLFQSGEKKLVCHDCGMEETIEAAILRGVNELKLLFPDIKITTNLVYEWCQVIGSRKMIGRILKKHFKMTGYGQWTHYE